MCNKQKKLEEIEKNGGILSAVSLDDFNDENVLEQMWNMCTSTVFRIKTRDKIVKRWIRHLSSDGFGISVFMIKCKDKRNKWTFYDFLGDDAICEFHTNATLKRCKSKNKKIKEELFDIPDEDNNASEKSNKELMFKDFSKKIVLEKYPKRIGVNMRGPDGIKKGLPEDGADAYMLYFRLIELENVK
jgi:hypothetical protein